MYLDIYTHYFRWFFHCARILFQQRLPVWRIVTWAVFLAGTKTGYAT